jgi:hypothetical protein
MDLPINDKELATIVSSLRLGGDVALYQKMNTVKQVRDSEKTLREQYGMVI